MDRCLLKYPSVSIHVPCVLESVVKDVDPKTDEIILTVTSPLTLSLILALSVERMNSFTCSKNDDMFMHDNHTKKWKRRSKMS